MRPEEYEAIGAIDFIGAAVPARQGVKTIARATTRGPELFARAASKSVPSVPQISIATRPHTAPKIFAPLMPGAPKPAPSGRVAIKAVPKPAPAAVSAASFSTSSPAASAWEGADALTGSPQATPDGGASADASNDASAPDAASADRGAVGASASVEAPDFVWKLVAAGGLAFAAWLYWKKRKGGRK